MRNNYINIQGWMVSELELSGNELLAYSIIYGFSQDGKSKFTGSSSYLKKWLGCTKKTVLRTLKKLVDKKLLERHEKTVNGVSVVDYTAITPVGTYLHRGGDKITPGGGDIFTPHNTNKDTIEDKKEKDLSENAKKEAVTIKEFIEYAKGDKLQIWRESLFVNKQISPEHWNLFLKEFRIKCEGNDLKTYTVGNYMKYAFNSIKYFEPPKSKRKRIDLNKKFDQWEKEFNNEQ